jgi:uncharacterized protein
MLLYLHGFNSSAQSGKAQKLLAWAAARGLPATCPDLPDRASAAMALCEQIIAASPTPVTLIGSSLGGFYAVWLAEKHGVKAVLINPCVACDEKIAKEVGVWQKNWNGGADYLFTAAHLADLQALRVVAISRPERYLLLVETGDEVLDYREACAYFTGTEQVILDGGDHGFTRFTDYLSQIAAF